jgi:hypothetical protein
VAVTAGLVPAIHVFHDWTKQHGLKRLIYFERFGYSSSDSARGLEDSKITMDNPNRDDLYKTIASDVDGRDHRRSTERRSANGYARP